MLCAHRTRHATMPSISDGIIAMHTAPLITTICHNLPTTIAIYLFGSAGTPYERADSDIDIAILAKHKIDFATKLMLTQQLMKLTHKDVDLIDLWNAPPLLKIEIIMKGKLLYNADPFKVDLFASRSLSEYVLFNEERREIVNDIIKRGSVYDR